jgi:hypothetical protein
VAGEAHVNAAQPCSDVDVPCSRGISGSAGGTTRQTDAMDEDNATGSCSHLQSFHGQYRYVV